ncbi:hypothetical protein D3C84_1005530 [compost metagenome]
MPERLDFLVVINQEITSPGVLLEKHDPLLGVGRVCDHMGVKGHAFGVFAFHSFTIHVSHHATRALKILYLQCMPAQLHLNFLYKHLQPPEAVDQRHFNYHCMLILCTCIH